MNLSARSLRAVLVPIMVLFWGTGTVLNGAAAGELSYSCSDPPLFAEFEVAGAHYSGRVNCGNLFLQEDIPDAPVVKWKGAQKGELYTLMMLDFDGNACGSYPDAVPEGENSPVRHWIVGNIPGELLADAGYVEAAHNGRKKDPAKNDPAEKDPAYKEITVVQPYRSPHIPVVSDRYGLYLFKQFGRISFQDLNGPITNFNHREFIEKYKLGEALASNYFVAVYTSESPFSGKTFHGNELDKVWHKNMGKGKLRPGQPAK